MSCIVVTGGAGFIGSNFIEEWLRVAHADAVINIDKLTYAGSRETLAQLSHDPRHVFLRADICDRQALEHVLATYRPRAVVHFAAESHVDRSIERAEAFVQTNVVGTFQLLEAARRYRAGLAGDAARDFRFLHVSTDEVFGSLQPGDAAFTEQSPYAPNSPYSASKAAADHLVRASFQTHGLPVLTVHCSNNYGPRQVPEKLIPLMIANALAGRPLPIYGDGLHARDWLHVTDHCAALRAILARGRAGESYNVGGGNEKTNLEVVNALCHLLDTLHPRSSGSYHEQLAFVRDRPGHDRRYAIDAGKLRRELGWMPAESFENGLRKTVTWYLAQRRWLDNMVSSARPDELGCAYDT